MSLNITITVCCVFGSELLLSQISFPCILSLLGRAFKFTLKLADWYCLSEMLVLIQDTLAPHLECDLHTIVCCNRQVYFSIKIIYFTCFIHAMAEISERPDFKCSPFHNVLKLGMVFIHPHKDYSCHLPLD